MSIRITVPALAVVSCLVASSSTALAQASGGAARKQGSFGTAKPVGALLTRNELRACLALQQRVRTGSDTATRERDLLEEEKAEIVQQGQTLKEQLAALDRTSQEAVDKYNAEAVARDRRIDALEARMPAYHQKLEALGVDRDAWRKGCENRRYDEIDEIQIKRGK
jgi:hypothetical protein